MGLRYFPAQNAQFPLHADVPINAETLYIFSMQVMIFLPFYFKDASLLLIVFNKKKKTSLEKLTFLR
jgi:hypothetical protein